MRANVMRSGLAALVVILTLVAVVCRPSAAAEIEGVHFADHMQSGDVPFDLECVGLLRYKLFFKAYVAALYMGAGVPAAQALDDVPKRLELSYFWSISASDFARAGDEILARNVDSQTLAALRPRLKQINALYEDVKPGDRYSLTYIPGVGTELALNGVPKGIIRGADFAAAYFSIWLGERPIDASLRKQLLDCGAGGSDQARAAVPGGGAASFSP